MKRMPLCAMLVAHSFIINSSFAADPTVLCESGKLKVAGKYASCALGADSKAVKTGGSPDYSKCTSTFSIKWQGAEVQGAGMHDAACIEPDALGLI